jgi:hypothetical protein
MNQHPFGGTNTIIELWNYFFAKSGIKIRDLKKVILNINSNSLNNQVETF